MGYSGHGMMMNKIYERGEWLGIGMLTSEDMKIEDYNLRMVVDATALMLCTCTII